MSVLNVEHANKICRATVNRPDVHNAVNFELMDRIEDLLTQLENNNQTRCLILTGSGNKAFISGGDLREFHSIKSAEEAKAMSRRMHSILNRIEKLPCWTIAAINGSAYGGGCEILLACDFRIANSQAKFGFTQSKFYLPPGWGGLTRLIDRVGRSTALLWLAEASVIDAETALDHNLIDRINTSNDLRERTYEWAQKLIINDRDFIQNLKLRALQFNKSRSLSTEAEIEPFSTFWESEEHHSRVQQFLSEKKKGESE